MSDYTLVAFAIKPEGEHDRHPGDPRAWSFFSDTYRRQGLERAREEAGLMKTALIAGESRNRVFLVIYKKEHSPFRPDETRMAAYQYMEAKAGGRWTSARGSNTGSFRMPDDGIPGEWRGR